MPRSPCWNSDRGRAAPSAPNAATAFRSKSAPTASSTTSRPPSTLARDLGLGDQLITASEAAGRNRYLLLDGKLHLLPHSMRSFLGSDLLSWHGKFGMIAERWRRRRVAQDDESIDAFARRRAGPEVADVFADGLVTGIYAGDPRLLSVRACFPRLAAFEEQHGSVLKGFARAAKQRRADARARGETPPKPGKLWSLAGGLGSLIDTLQGRLGARLRTGVNVRRIARADAAAGPSSATARMPGRPTPSCSPARLTSRRPSFTISTPSLPTALAPFPTTASRSSPWAIVAPTSPSTSMVSATSLRSGRGATSWACNGVRRSMPGVHRTARCCCGRCREAGIAPKSPAGTMTG